MKFSVVIGSKNDFHVELGLSMDLIWSRWGSFLAISTKIQKRLKWSRVVKKFSERLNHSAVNLSKVETRNFTGLWLDVPLLSEMTPSGGGFRCGKELWHWRRCRKDVVGKCRGNQQLPVSHFLHPFVQDGSQWTDSESSFDCLVPLSRVEFCLNFLFETVIVLKIHAASHSGAHCRDELREISTFAS